MKTFGTFMIVAAVAAGAAAPGLRREAPSAPDGVKAVLETHCSGCHKGAFAPKGLKLGPRAVPGSIVGVASKEKPDLELVAPGSPETSYLLMKIKGAEGIAGKTMPPPGKPSLAPEEIALLEEWIKALD